MPRVAETASIGMPSYDHDQSRFDVAKSLGIEARKFVKADSPVFNLNGLQLQQLEQLDEIGRFPYSIARTATS